MSGKISESMFSGKTTFIPMADVQHVEKEAWQGVPGGPVRTQYTIITKHTRKEDGKWINPIVLEHHEGAAFMKSWCDYRYELENLEENGVKMP